MLRLVLLSALIAVYVARPLLVSESAATGAGDGLPLVMLTILLAIVGGAATAGFRGAMSFGWADAAWLALLAWQAIGTFVAMRDGAARAAINQCWEWVGIGVGFILLRQLLADDRERRAAIVVMIALAVLLSSYGLFQFYVSLPAMREEYRLHPDAVLRAAGVVAPLGSPARLLFEQRLRSTEPMATFALANSLAGFLVPWLTTIVGIGCLAHVTMSGRSAWRRGWPLAVIAKVLIAALPIAACLVLTKSRSAYVAGLGGTIGAILVCRFGGTRSGRAARISIIVLAAAAVVFVAIAIGGRSLDREIFTEAAKSLSYRWQYWQAALRMIGDYPWFGCGLGNFQDCYTQYKLPEASEVVADPHSFLLEIWSTSGTPALLAFLAVFAGSALDLRRSPSSTCSAPRADAGETFGRPPRAGIFAVVGGAAAGFVLAFLIGLFSTVTVPIELVMLGPMSVAAIALLGWGWIDGGELPRTLLLVAVAALLVNLLAAGGIGFGGVAGSLWLLLAIALGLGRDCTPAAWMPRSANIFFLLASIVLAVGCYFSAYSPVLHCRMLLAQAEADPNTAEQSLRAAAAADRWADQPWRELADLNLSHWVLRHDRQSLESWKKAQRELLRRRPRSSAAWRQAGDGYSLVYRKTGDRAELTEAIEHYRRAVELYPNHSLGHAHLALSLRAAGQTTDAGSAAAAALRLHRRTPHLDQKLSPEVVQQLEDFSL